MKARQKLKHHFILQTERRTDRLRMTVWN